MAHQALPDSRPVVPGRYVEVDAARLLLVIAGFARDASGILENMAHWGGREVSRYLTPEYYLQKLDFLLRNPAYLARELLEVHRQGVPEASDGQAIKAAVRAIYEDREPELNTLPFKRFWHGAYENLDRVEAWWHARALVYVHVERRGEAGSVARPQKYFFLTPLGEQVAVELVERVEHARWYYNRIALIHEYLGGLTPSALKELQYGHPEYREADLNDFIPSLTSDDLEFAFAEIFGEPLLAIQD